MSDQRNRKMDLTAIGRMLLIDHRELILTAQNSTPMAFVLDMWNISLFLAVTFLSARGFPLIAPPLALRVHSQDNVHRHLRSTASSHPTAHLNNAGEASIGDITIVIPSNDGKSKFGTFSPVGNPSIAEAARHLANKAFWFADGLVDTSVVSVPIEATDSSLFDKLCQTDVLIALGIQSKDEMEYLGRLFVTRRTRETSLRTRQCHFALDCSKNLPAVVGPFDEENPSLQAKFLPWTQNATARRLFEQMTAAFSRWTSDDFCYALMIFLNQFSGSKIDWVKYSIDATWEKGPVQNAKEIYGMVTKCKDCIASCLADETCRECVGKLTKVDSRDQVSSYRTLISYESDLLREFSQCILTRNNVFGCDAKIPTIPKVKALSTWRGKPLTEEAGRAILVGHLDDPAAPDVGLKTDVSWKVACGANVAYDQFPSQNQLFYPAARGRDLWYDPVFRVETIDGRHVWCTRHYRVRPGPKPGTFRFSVLDNGVTSDEFWNIVGAADDLSWVVFHYAGAAAAVGQRYLGGLLCTADGSLPDESELPVIWDCLRSAGIQPWELYTVKYDPTAPGAIAAGPPPLDTYRASVLKSRAVETA